MGQGDSVKWQERALRMKAHNPETYFLSHYTVSSGNNSSVVLCTAASEKLYFQFTLNKNFKTKHGGSSELIFRESDPAFLNLGKNTVRTLTNTN